MPKRLACRAGQSGKDAQMAELVDAPASGAGTRKGVEVRVLFWAPLIHILQSDVV